MKFFNLFSRSLLFIFLALLLQSQSHPSGELRLAGTSGYVEIPYDSLLNPSLRFTNELWARLDKYDSAFHPPFSSRDVFVGTVFYASDFNYWNLWLGTGNIWTTSWGPKVRVGEWTHLAAVFDHGLLKFYVNGILYREVRKHYLPNRRRPLRFGFSSDGFDLNFAGAVDEVKVWSTARTQQEIIASMLGKTSTNDEGLLAWWTFDRSERTGRIVANAADPSRFSGALVGESVLSPTTRPLEFPLFVTDKEIIEFPEEDPGVSQFDTLTVINPGKKELSGWVWYEGKKDIIVDSMWFSVKPGGMFRVPVKFSPVVDGRKTGTIRFRHNGLGEEREIVVTGNCRMPRVDSVSFDFENSKGIIRGKNFTQLATAQVFIGNLRAPVRDVNEREIVVSIPPGAPFGKVNVSTFFMTVTVPQPVSVPSSVKGSITPPAFAPPQNVLEGEAPPKIHLTDLDGNGKSDLIVADPENPVVAIYPDIELPADPSIAKRKVTVPLSAPASLILTEDFDGDGKFDLLTVSATSKEMSVYRNLSSVGRILFEHDQTLPVETDPVAVAAGDLNDDLKKDIVLVCGVSRMMYIFRNIGGYEFCRFQFEWRDYTQRNPGDIVISDLDGDKKNDLAFSGNHENTLLIFQNFTNHGKFIFESAQAIIGSGSVSSLQALDVDGDGREELITLNRDVNTFSVYKNISNGYVRFGERTDIPTGNAPVAMSVGDMTGDGKPEIIVANENGRSLSVYTNAGGLGTFIASAFGERTDIPVNGSPVALRLHDADFDGRPDLFVTDGRNRAVLVIRNEVVPDSPWFWVWIGAGAIGAFGSLLLGVRYAELKKIRKQIAALEEERRLQDEFSKKMIESQENERTRIAQELHDGLGQELLLIKNSALLSLMKEDDAPKMKDQLKHISDATSKVIKIARDISYNLRPAELDRLGLSETLRSIVVELRKSTAVNVNGEVDNIDGLMPKEMEINIVRIVQEATANALKHSGGSELTIAVNAENGYITIVVEDNGKGLPPGGVANTGNKKGLGLAGIDERVRIMKGTLAFRSAPDEGTAVTVTIPVNGR